jgi:hypothetical protein
MRGLLLSECLTCVLHRQGHQRRAGHSLIFSRFAVRSPLNFFLWIADAHAFIFLISLFARRSNARRSTSGSLSEKGLNHSSLSINILINIEQVTHTKEGDRNLRGINRSVLLNLSGRQVFFCHFNETVSRKEHKTKTVSVYKQHLLEQ